jgi:predicted Zn-dependent protease
VQKEIATLQSKNAQIGTTPLVRAPFVKSLDGVITGASTEITTVRNNTIYNRPYGIIATAPPGWLATTQPGAVFAFTTPGKSMEGLTVQEVPVKALQGQGYSNAQGAIRTQLQNMGLRYVTSGAANTASGQRFDIDIWTGQTNSGTVAVESTQLVEGENVLVFLQIGPANNNRRADLVSMLRGMQFDRARARSVEPPRMRVGTSRAGDTWEEIARRSTGHVEDAKTIAAMNGFDYPSAVPAGITLKLPEEVIKAQS